MLIDEHLGKCQVKGFAGVTNNDWFAYVTLLKQDWPQAQGLRVTATKFKLEKVWMVHPALVVVSFVKSLI